MSSDEIIETFIIGLIGTMFLAVIGAIIFLFVKFPWLLAAVAGLSIIIFFVGWCITHYDEWLQDNKQPPLPVPINSYNIPILDGLERFEDKYHMSTVKFIWYVYNEWMPHGMNNLDYLEWIAMANSLASVTMNREEKGGK